MPLHRRDKMRWALLVGVAALVTTAEAVAVALGGITAAPLAPQAAALYPFGTFHDLRWLLVFHDGWLAFGAELAALVVFRTVLTTALVRLAWPDDVDRPPIGAQLARSAIAVGVALVALLASALLLFSMAVASLSWPLFAAVPVTLAVAMLSAHAAVVPGWWRQLPPKRAVGLVLGQAVFVMLAAAAITVVPTPVVVLVALAAGAVDAVLWAKQVDVLARVVPAERRVPVAPLAVAGFHALALAGLAVFVGIGPSSHEPQRPPQSVRAAAATEPDPVLVAAGFGSSWDGTSPPDLGPGLHPVRFSYRGLGPGDRPLAYEAADTHQSIEDLAQRMDEQVQALHRRTGEPVVIVATSEATVVARTYLEQGTRPAVRELIMLSPLVRPGRVYYPSDGHAGWGQATGWFLDGLGSTLSSLSGWQLDPDMPMLRSLVDHAPALRLGMMCPEQGTEISALLPIGGVTAAPSTADLDVPVRVVGGFHGTAVDPAEIRTLLRRSITDGGGNGPAIVDLGAETLRAAASAWHVPELPLSLNDAWDSPAAGQSSCDFARAEFRRWTADGG